MKTKNIFLYTLFIFILLNSFTSCKNEVEKSIPQAEKNFFLQIILSPSFHRGCDVEISSINNNITLKIIPQHWIGDQYLDLIVFPPLITEISNYDFLEFKNRIKGLDLKTIKNGQGVCVDGISATCIYSDLKQYHNYFYFSNSNDDSDYSLLAETVLELCMKYINFDPTAKVIEDVATYYNESFGIRKVNDYDNYYRFFNGNESLDSVRDFTDFFAKLPNNRRIIFDLSNIEFIPNSFRKNFHKYAKRNDKIIFWIEDYEKYYCGTQPQQHKRHLGKILAENYLKDGNFFFDNKKLLKNIDPDYDKNYPSPIIINNNLR